jgi:hypothetical protein
MKVRGFFRPNAVSVKRRVPNSRGRKALSLWAYPPYREGCPEVPKEVNRETPVVV